MEKFNLIVNRTIAGFILVIIMQGCVKKPAVVIYFNPKADRTEILAARETRKYIYQRTGQLLPINEWDEKKPINGDAIIVGSLCQLIGLPADALPELKKDEFILKTLSSPEGKKLLIYGGSSIGSLYAAYYYAEQLGIGFYLEGDVVPDKQIPFVFPELDIKQTAQFSIRGIQPFHDFPEGPDWWSLDDYKAIIAQLPKLRMNFIGFHTYPEKGGVVGAEPLVWIGSPWNIESDGRVKSSYFSSHFVTSTDYMDENNYKPMNTSEYYFGASQIFEKDNFGADYMTGLESNPKSSVQENELFNRFGLLLSDAFTFAQGFEIKTCVGTETPLTVPKKVDRYMRLVGKDPKDPKIPRKIFMADGSITAANLNDSLYLGATGSITAANLKDRNDPKILQKIYEGIFERIKIAHPLDYYWLWTPENWFWKPVPQEQVDVTVSDLKAAFAAAKEVDAPFTLATCGWVLGPNQDRALFDNFLPKEMPMSTINPQCGWLPVDPGFAKVQGRPKWAIPWLEDDLSIIAPQLWVGRIRKDAADALAYGCNGLIGIHWRTRIMGPNISALAHAAWDSDYPDSLNSFISSKKNIQPNETGNQSRNLPSNDLYMSWAKISFGEEKSEEIANIFSSLDGGEYFDKGKNNLEKYKANLPKPSTWRYGPGGIVPDERPWEEVQKEYLFINKLEDIRSQLKGPGNLERFDYWLNQFKYLREIGHLNCVWFQFNKAMEEINISNPEDQQILALDEALPLRIEMVDILTEMQNFLIASTTTYGEMGIIANWHQHNLPRMIHEPNILLEKYLNKELPEEAKLPTSYTGSPHMFVSKVRTILEKGENMNLKIRTVSADNAKPVEAKIFWRMIGQKKFNSRELNHLARGVYEFQLNSQEIPDSGLEYYVEVSFKNGDKIKFPASAPTINQAVTLLPD